MLCRLALSPVSPQGTDPFVVCSQAVTCLLKCYRISQCGVMLVIYVHHVLLVAGLSWLSWIKLHSSVTLSFRVLSIIICK